MKAPRSVALVTRSLRLIEPRHRRRLGLNIPFAIITSAVEVSAVLLLASFLQSATSGEPMSEKFGWVADLTGVDSEGSLTALVGGAIAFLFLARTLLAAAFLWWQLGVVTSGESATATSLFNRYLRAPMSFHSANDSAAALRDLSLVPNTVFRSVLIPAVTVGGDSLMLVGTGAVLVLADVGTGVGALVFFAAVGGMYVLAFGERIRALNATNQDFAYLSLRQVQEGFIGAATIQAYNAEPHFIGQFAELRTRWSVVRQRTAFLAQAPRFYLEVMFVVGLVLLGAALAATSTAEEAFATAGVMLIVMLRMLPSLTRLLGALNTIRAGEPAVDRWEAINRQLDLARRTRGSGNLDLPFTREIKLDNVSVRYGDAFALRSVNLTIRRGESVGIIGRSGAGKTTLVDVMLGLVEPSEGFVWIDDRVLTVNELSSWRSHIAYVTQDTFIIDDTVERNIVLSSDTADNDGSRLQRALERAQLTSVVQELPAGVATRLGERGRLLSGGQRQRVGLARALYRDPAVLVLDEATSSLDNETQQLITDFISSMRNELTVIVIAHRFATVATCDRLVLLDDGRVVDSGTRLDLLRRNPEFGQLLRWSDPEQTTEPALDSVET